MLLAAALLPLCVSASPPTAPVEEHRPGNEPPVAETPPPSPELNPPLMEKAPVAEPPRPVREETRLDLGLAAGLNTPSGEFGVELEFRPIEWLGLQVGGGTGEWGYRLSPLMRVYPLGRKSFSPFLEAGASFNLGQEATVGGDEARQPVDLLFTPVAVVGLGVRGDLGAHAFITPRVGWGKRLRQDNIRSDTGRLLDPSGEFVNSLEQQEGLLVGLSVGVSFL
jgi:hypothetical protein